MKSKPGDKVVYAENVSALAKRKGTWNLGWDLPRRHNYAAFPVTKASVVLSELIKELFAK
jgi:hypothetical protein